MTIEEMKKLKIGDRVIDLKYSNIRNKDIICRVNLIDNEGIIISSISLDYSEGYPHRFSFETDSHLLEYYEVSPYRIGE